MSSSTEIMLYLSYIDCDLDYASTLRNCQRAIYRKFNESHIKQEYIWRAKLGVLLDCVMEIESI